MNDLAFDLFAGVGIGFTFGCALAILVARGRGRTRASPTPGSTNGNSGGSCSSYGYRRLGEAGDLLSERIRTVRVDDVICYSRDGEISNYAYYQKDEVGNLGLDEM